MYIRVTDTGVIKNYSLYQLKQDSPEIVVPNPASLEFLESVGVFLAKQNVVPNFDVYSEYLSPGDPYQVDGEWFFDFVVEKHPENIASANVRSWRNELLSACDWTQLKDSPVDSAAWAVYRQELRDLPQQAGFPYSVVWPTEPTS